MTEVGANPTAAAADGRLAGTIAISFANVTFMFDQVVRGTRDAAAEPPIQPGYLSYGEQFMTTIAEVEAHGITFSGNITSAAVQVHNNDAGITADMDARQALLRSINLETVRE
ncbi:hypothetical protein F8568_021710 [Actinomadura sp. LD22]|uniref:Uncharacterized protein n=1 Tax=Actinomadura physcomitrii TaxID=2650748 RepID=A0A6I4ML41_9ACTN|nr:hypothetical protein [Actinomadura physcomitrii]MWA02946.1 hypothetical protein [Actinomadura physcomitrii]